MERTAQNQSRKVWLGVLAILSTAVLTMVIVSRTVVAADAPDQKPVTFANDIAPILQRSCQNCHNPLGELAPMSLTTFQEVRPWAKTIKTRTLRREMPPWFIENNVGIQQKFKDDISLSDDEIKMIGRWVDTGAPEGNPADMPPPRQFTPAGVWGFGEPDLVVSSPVITVKAAAGDYQPFYVGAAPTGLTEDRWLEAFQVREYRPGETRRVTGRSENGNNYFSVHHQIVSSTPLGEQEDGGAEATSEADQQRAFEQLARDGVGGANKFLQRGEFSYTYEVGQNAQYMPPDGTIALKAGSTIYFNGGHFHSIGKEVNVQIQVGFKFYPRGYVPKYPNRWRKTPTWGGGAELDIPGNTENVVVHQAITLQQPMKLVSFEPHLHAGGRRMCAEALYPDGTRETLTCAGYNHSWVKSYVYEDDYAPLLPKGTIVHFTAWYDNTARNRLVVDPRNWRGFGPRSIDEMFLFLGKWVAYTDAEFKIEVAARQTKQRINNPTLTSAK